MTNLPITEELLTMKATESWVLKHGLEDGEITIQPSANPQPVAKSSAGEKPKLQDVAASQSL